ncbi:esterase [Carnobacterium divergens]|nr:alpha/beta hydrolase [Carnobacterium divergens]TFI67282.1 esterase [Carnobacterium divergens]TFI67321.1 esterase [Carnobacterium divergens]TFI71083.1 esterase [Carnobacterium divergens]TFI82221.1 esterase [Carnobacterium divergens]TFI83756.1 esterase [Carnobacterium divergens]
MKERITYLSHNQETLISASIWHPLGAPKAILQISHGMAEFIDRYDDFARYLSENQFLVVGNDHLGHGNSVAAVEDRGYFSKGNGKQHVIEDIKKLHDLIKIDYPHLPYFLMGHSMGSFIVRNFLQQYGDTIDGAILMGTSGPKPELNFILSPLTLLNKISPKTRNPLVDKLAFGSFSSYFEETGSDFNWLSKNQQNVAWYEEHPQTGFIFTNNGFLTLFTLLNDGTKKGWATTIPTELPILVISGDQDPVGGMGKGVRKVFHELEDAQFTDITLCMYPELRHEILMEDSYLLVYQDLLNWLNRHL